MSRQVWTAFAAVAAVALAVVAPSCTIGFDPDSVTLTVQEDTDPEVVLVAPFPNDQVGDELTVVLRLRNFRLVPPEGQDNAADEGHLRVFIDGVCIEQAEGECRAIVEAAFKILVAPLASNEPETHTLRVEVRNNDGTLSETLQPQVVEWVKLPSSGGS